jgi:hypothetical protein
LPICVRLQTGCVISFIEIFGWLIFAGTVAYYGSLTFFVFYLRSRHNEKWKSFAGKGPFHVPERYHYLDFWRWFRIAIYALFQKGHWQLKDSTVTMLVFAIRILCVALTLAALYAWLK